MAPRYKKNKKTKKQKKQTAIIRQKSQKQTEAALSSVIPQCLKKRYLLKKLLGVGGMGLVYKALDLRRQEVHDPNPFIAVKILSQEFCNNPQARLALCREYAKTRILKHPAIITVHDMDRDGDILFFTMEYLDGAPLNERLAMRKQGYGHEGIPFVVQLLDALEYVHSCSIIHADIKPGNIFLTADKEVKLFDFSVARQFSFNKKGKLRLHDNTLFDVLCLGALTPAYASPESLEGEPANKSSEIFSIGCVIYEMLCGNHAFKRIPANEACKKNIRPQRIHCLGRRQWRYLKAALEYDPAKRLQSLRAMKEAFLSKSFFSGSIKE